MNNLSAALAVPAAVKRALLVSGLPSGTSMLVNEKVSQMNEIVQTNILEI